MFCWLLGENPINKLIKKIKINVSQFTYLHFFIPLCSISSVSCVHLDNSNNKKCTWSVQNKWSVEYWTLNIHSFAYIEEEGWGYKLFQDGQRHCSGQDILQTWLFLQLKILLCW